MSRRVLVYTSICQALTSLTFSAVFVAKTGKNDKLPAAFLTSLHAAATASSYQEAVRQTLKAGGSGMSGRAQLVRALFKIALYTLPLPLILQTLLKRFPKSKICGKTPFRRCVSQSKALMAGSRGFVLNDASKWGDRQKLGKNEYTLDLLGRDT